MKTRALRSAMSLVVSFVLILAPWPAWAQTARVVAAASAGASSAAGAGAAIISPLPSAPSPSLSPSLGALSAASLQAGSASPPLVRAAIGAALSAPVSMPAAQGAVPIPARPAAPVAAPLPSETQASALAAASVRGKTVIMVGTKGSRPFIMEEALRVARELGLDLVLVDDPANRANSIDGIPDSHFIPVSVNTRDAKTMGKIAETVAAHPVASRAHAVVGFMSLYANLTGKITDRLGVAGIPGAAVAAADDKPEARKLLNRDPKLEVPFRELRTVVQARKAYHEISDGGRYKVVLKTIRGENSRFLAMSLDSEEAVAAAYLKMDADVRDFVARPESKQTTFSAHPGLMMERMLVKSPGTEETSVEVVMQDGKAAFAMVTDTKGIGAKGELAGGIMIFPSQQPRAEHNALIEAAERAMNAIGIANGNARLDMMTTPDGPRVIEINPFMGGVAIWQAVKSLTGMSLVEQGLRSILGLPVDPGHAPDGVIHYIFLASSRNGTVAGIEGLDAAKRLPGVELARVFVEPGDDIVAAKGNAYEEWAEIIGKGKTWREAIGASLGAARRLVLKIKRHNGEIVRARGDYQQPTADDLSPLPTEAPAPAPEAAPSQAPGLFSKVVLGFLSTFVLVSTVVESTSLAVSQMTQPLTQGFLALAGLTVVSYLAYTAGALFGGRWVDKFGISRTYRTVLAVRTGIWVTIALLFNPLTGTLPLAALIGLFSLDYFFHSIGRVAEHKLQVAWFHDKPTSSSRFGSFRDFIEYGTVFVASAMGLAIAAFGFGAVIYPAPIAFAIAAGLAFLLKLPKATPAAAVEAKKAGWGAGFRGVFKNPGIAKPLLGYILLSSFLYMMYYIIATAFGAYVAGDPKQAAAVAGSLTGLYGVGALFGALAMDRLSRRIDKKTALLPEAQRDDAGRKLYAKSAAKSLIWTAAAMLGSWAFISQTALFTFVWPIFPISPILLLIGFTSQMAIIHLDTIMKDRIPKEDKALAGSILGAIRTLTYLSFVAGFLLWGGLFAGFGTATFWLFAAFYTAVALVYLKLARWLKNS
ncbi:MAG: MFS transporter [Elusimicrobiota bacterium]|nr:MFS transporter [Elusimicrobiota bacterium]